MCFMVENGSQLTGPCVRLPYKKSIWITTVSSKNLRKLLRVKYGDSLTPSARSLLLFQRNYVRVRRRGWTSPNYPPLLWESEASCRLHSPLDQTRDHSPVCKPPILQDIGNLEQETTVTHTLTSLSLTPRSLGWEMERLQNMETVLPAQVCAKPHTPDDHRSGEGMLHFNIFTRHSFSS